MYEANRRQSSSARRRTLAQGAVAEVTIERIGVRGDGVARAPDGHLYVPTTVPGDRVRVRYGPGRGEGRSADLLDVLVPGPGRTAPPCPHFGDCGGCALQHLEDDPYATWKLGRLTTAIRRAGIVAKHTDPLVRTLPGTRRRATFAAVRNGSGASLKVGYRPRRGHAVVGLEVCPVLAPEIVDMLPALRAALADIMRPHRSAEVAVTFVGGALDVVFIGIDPPDLSVRERLAAFAFAADVARVSWRLTDRDLPEPVIERRVPMAKFSGARVSIPPGAFLQASQEGEQALIRCVVDAIGDTASVADLFAGVGTLSLPLAAKGVRVQAKDADESQLSALLAGAREARLPVETEVRDLLRWPVRSDELNAFGAVIFDPPRAGARSQAQEIAASTVPLAIAVSCNPETFARDAAILADAGFQLDRVTPIDQFLWSPHLELVAVFRR